MKKILITSLIIAAVGTLFPAFASADILGSYKATVNNSSSQWFYDQQAGSNQLPQAQCAGAWVSKNYYMPGDYNSDGIKDYGVPLYLRDNFAVVGGNVPTYLVGARSGGYGGTSVRYALPGSASNVLRVLNGTQTYDLNTQSAWYRLSKTAPKDVWVRAVESEPMLISAPSTNSINDRSFQIAYQIRYRAFQSTAAGTSDYDVWPVSNSAFMGPLFQSSDRWALKANWAPIPDRQQDYQQTSSVLNTTAIQWNSNEITHPYECFNVTTHWCGDGVPDNGAFDNVSANEQCDLGPANGQPGSTCSASCTNIIILIQNPDVTVVKSVTGSRIQGQNVTYKIHYNNIGLGAATNVQIVDTLGTGLTFNAASSSLPVSSVVNNPNGTTTITWNLGTVPAGYQGDITFDAQIKTTVPNCSTVLNKVHIGASNELPANTLNNDYEVTHPIQCPSNPQLWIQKDVVASTGGYMPNGYAMYTISYGNSGSGAATGVTFTDTLPNDVTFVSSTPAVTVNGQNLSLDIGTLNPGQQGLIKIYVKINANVPICQNYIVLNKGRVQATNYPYVEDDATFVVLCYDLWSTKVIDKPVVASGDVVTYTIRYGNFGPLTAPNWSLFDQLPTGLNYVFNSSIVLSGVNIGQPIVTGTPVAGQILTWTGFTNMPAGYSGLVQIKATVLGPVASGHVYVNKVCIEGDNYYNNNNCGTAITTTTGFTSTGTTSFYDVRIAKSVNKTLVAAGDHVIYTLVVTNESDVTSPITGYTVKDYLPAGVDYFGNPTGPAGMNATLSNNSKDILFDNLPALAPGASITITFEAIYNSATYETNYTEVCNYEGTGSTINPKDRDSSPCNRGRNPKVEDDEDQVTIGPGSSGQNPECQGLSAIAGNPDQVTSASAIDVTYECRTTWSSNVDAVLQCGNGQVFTGLTSNAIPFQATCHYTNPTTARAICVVARRPNPACELPVNVRSSGGGGGGRSPYCGDGIVRVGEQCDPGNPALGIRPAGVPAGKVCRSDCTYANQPGGMSAQVKCSYIDPPAINVGEYMPYWWDMEYGYNISGTGYSLATSMCTSAKTDTRINKNSLNCEFTLQGPNGATKTWNNPCYTTIGGNLASTALQAAKIKYDMNIFPGGLDAKQITGAYYLGLGEYMITMKVVSASMCNGDRVDTYDRVCQMNFGVTKQYAVSRNTHGTFSSTDDLDTYKRQDTTPVLKTTELIKVLQPFTLTNADKNLILQMTNKYVSLAVKATTIDTQLTNNSTASKAIVSKVPGKNIFVIDAKRPDGTRGLITVLDNATYAGGAFTLIVINGDLTIKGNLTKNPNGMFIVRDGTLTFSAAGDAQENNQDQLVKGIFIGLSGVKAEGDGYEKAFNDDLDRTWVNGGRLTINGIILGGDLTKLVENRRSVVENWFDKRAGDGLLDDGSIVIKANPEVFTNLPPGAEDLSLTLNVFKD